MKKVLITSFLQAAFLSLYISLVGLIFLYAPVLFGNAPGYTGFLVFLFLFVVSALVCGFIVFWQPFLLWEKKKTSEAIRLVFYTIAWLVFFVLVLLMLRI